MLAGLPPYTGGCTACGDRQPARFRRPSRADVGRKVVVGDDRIAGCARVSSVIRTLLVLSGASPPVFTDRAPVPSCSAGATHPGDPAAGEATLMFDGEVERGLTGARVYPCEPCGIAIIAFDASFLPALNISPRSRQTGAVRSNLRTTASRVQLRRRTLRVASPLLDHRMGCPSEHDGTRRSVGEHRGAGPERTKRVLMTLLTPGAAAIRSSPTTTFTTDRRHRLGLLKRAGLSIANMPYIHPCTAVIRPTSSASTRKCGSR